MIKVVDSLCPPQFISVEEVSDEFILNRIVLATKITNPSAQRILYVTEIRSGLSIGHYSAFEYVWVNFYIRKNEINSHNPIFFNITEALNYILGIGYEVNILCDKSELKAMINSKER